MVLRFPERVSGAEARLFAERIGSELCLDRPRVIADLSRVRQIDSQALHVLLECLIEVTRQDGEFYLGAVSPEAATVLELTQMDTVFEILPDVAEASASFSVAEMEHAPETSVVVHPAAA